MASKRISADPAERAWLEQQLQAVTCRGLTTEWRGPYAYLSVSGEPICRYGYIKEPHVWECTLWKPTQNRYGGDGFCFPSQMPPAHSLRQALWAFNYPHGS